MRKLFTFLWQSSRLAFLLAVLSGIAGGVGGVCLIALIPMAFAETSTYSFSLGRVFHGVCLVTIVARIATQMAMIRMAERSIAGLIRHLCTRILRMSLRRFEENDPGRVMAILTEDVMVLSAAIGALPLLGINATVFFGCFLYLAYVSLPVFVCTFLFAFPAILSHEYLIGRGRKLMHHARGDHDALVSHFRELVEGFQELKLHRERREAFLEQSIRAASERVCLRNTAGFSWFAAVAGWGQLLYFGYLGFLVFGLPSLIEIPRGALAASVVTVIYAMSPLDSLLASIPVLARAAASMKRIEILGLSLETEAQAENGEPTFPKPSPILEEILLNEVTYIYPPEADGEGFALGPLSLAIRPGEILFVVGGNGSGKTTLLKLLTGLYPPHTGKIVYNGIDIGCLDRESYQSVFSVVFADGFLFASLLGVSPEGLDDRAMELISELGLEGVVGVEEGQLTTTRLSQGQRKRLALIGACLEDRTVMVFDEWAAFQDPTFKKTFYLEILPALKARGKTLVVITHDDSYFYVADRVVHLSAGLVSDTEVEFKDREAQPGFDAGIPILPFQ